MRKIGELSGCVLLGIAAVMLSSIPVHAAEQWWDARWDHRCALTIVGAGAAVTDVPVILRGAKLREMVGGEALPPSSLRVVTDGREVPCQYDAFADGGLRAVPPNAAVGGDDELVFQAELPAEGTATYWLYWNSMPLPPGAYPSRSLMGDAMEPASWHHDYQLWNDQCFVAMRGPVRTEAPTENKKENYGGGTVVQLRVLGQTVVKYPRAWNDVFPQGAFAATPHEAANRWSLPRELVRGPVRVAAHCILRDVNVAGKDAAATANADVFHRVWLYERGAYVCFDEIVRACDSVTNLDMSYSYSIRYGSMTNELLWYAQAGDVKTFHPTAEQLEETRKTKKIILNTGGVEPWMAGYSVAKRKGYVAVFDATASDGSEHPPIGSYTRLYTTIRLGRKIPSLASGETAGERFWIVGLEGDVAGETPRAFWRILTKPEIEFGPVERRDP